MKEQKTICRPGTKRSAASAPVISFPLLSTTPSESGIAALILNLRRNSPAAPDAVRQLYELTYRIVEPYVGLNLAAPQLEDQVNDLTALALDVIFSRALARPSSLPDFIRTLARQWNRVPSEPRSSPPSRPGRLTPISSVRGLK